MINKLYQLSSSHHLILDSVFADIKYTIARIIISKIIHHEKDKV